MMLSSSSSSSCHSRRVLVGVARRAMLLSTAARRLPDAARKPYWASVDPWQMSGENPHAVKDLLRGEWITPKEASKMPDPLNGEDFLKVGNASDDKYVMQFAKSNRECSKSGLHNPHKNVERYLMLGDVCAKAAAEMAKPQVEDFFTKLIQRVAPKSDAQARGEYLVTAAFVRNFSGDQVRFLARSFGVPGDHLGQQSQGMRWPYGPVALISPFNFPLEIPMLQLMGALFMGNKVVMKNDQRVSVVMEQAMRLLHESGLPPTDVDVLNAGRKGSEALVLYAAPRMTQFTGSQDVAEKVSMATDGKVKLEDAGFDWKVLGPDVGDVEYVAHTSDQDAYAYSGQKCSAQSILFVHENWNAVDFVPKLAELAARRKLSDLTVGPVLSVADATFEHHRDSLLKIPGAKLAFGGRTLRPLDDNAKKIPKQYGCWEPTAVFVPLKELLESRNFSLCTTEIFGPFQVITDYDDSTLHLVVAALEKLEAHLTAAIVSNDEKFTAHMVGNTVNGTTYVGRRARTTGAPQNHWFGPAGDPRGGGIGTPEAIKVTWSCHREIIHDKIVPDGWTTPAAT